jgi:hypothetical protein
MIIDAVRSLRFDAIIFVGCSQSIDTFNSHLSIIGHSTMGMKERHHLVSISSLFYAERYSNRDSFTVMNFTIVIDQTSDERVDRELVVRHVVYLILCMTDRTSTQLMFFDLGRVGSGEALLNID